MALALRMVLTAQGMISSVVGNDNPTNSRMECVRLCVHDKSCKALFHDDFNNHCFLSDEFHNVTAMSPAHANMKYYEVHSDPCNNGYTYNRGLNLCYKVFSMSIDWFKARSNCSKDGAHLIRVRSDVVNNLMFQEAKLAGTSLWTDGRRSQDHFEWQDRSVVQIEFWATNEPNGNRDHCILISVQENVASSSWHGLRWFNTAAYVCQIDMDVTGC